MAATDISKKGAMELIGHEGVVQTRYKDSVGVWTIGVGHTKAAGAPDPETFLGAMPMQDVFDLFLVDLRKYVAAVSKALKVPVEQHEFDALVSFHFNTGGIGRATLVKTLNAGDRKKAAEQFMNWRKPAAIIPRRQKEQKLFSTGFYSHNGMATLFPADANGKVNFGKGKQIDLTDHIT